MPKLESPQMLCRSKIKCNNCTYFQTNYQVKFIKLILKNILQMKIEDNYIQVSVMH